jgi:3-methyladenine DNA glycosylase/8-oxoguanine DNA glycosylase
MTSARLALPSPYDFDETLRFTRFGPGDPTSRRGDGWFVKAMRTPAGPVTLRLERPEPPIVVATALGEGAEWMLPRVPALLGLSDQPPPLTFHRPLQAAARRFRGLRLARVPWVLDKLAAFVLQQRVTFDDAVESYRQLMRVHGEPAPGPDRVRLMPASGTMLRITDDEWRRMGVDRQRRDALRQVYRYAHRICAMVDMDSGSVRRRLLSLRGVGPWTVEMTMGFAFGNPDALPPGDYHLPDIVAWALAGEARGDDARMIELLEPYRGQRFRVIRLLRAARIDAPRFGPRAATGRQGPAARRRAIPVASIATPPHRPTKEPPPRNPQR